MACVRASGEVFVVTGATEPESDTGGALPGDADAFRDKVGPEARQRLTPAVPATITLQDYADHWTRLISHTVKRRTPRPLHGDPEAPPSPSIRESPRSRS
jgi:hypothetical protein